MNPQDAIQAALAAATEYSDYVKGVPDECGADLHGRLTSILLNLAHAMEELVRHPVQTDSDSNRETWQDDYRFARSKFSHILEKDFYRVATLDDATYSDAKERIFMLDDDLADIYADISESLCLLGESAESKLIAAENLILNYEIHWSNHLYKALLSLNQLRFGSFV